MYISPPSFTLSAMDCPESVEVHLIPPEDAEPGDSQIVHVTAVITTDLGDVELGGISVFDRVPLPCDCGVWGDVSCDNMVNPVDVVRMVNYVYKGIDARCHPPNCPLQTGDVNCSGGVPNPVDVVVYVNRVYKAQPFPCGDPCQ